MRFSPKVGYNQAMEIDPNFTYGSADYPLQYFPIVDVIKIPRNENQLLQRGNAGFYKMSTDNSAYCTHLIDVCCILI